MQRLLLFLCCIFLTEYLSSQQDTVLQSKIYVENANNQITDVSGPESIQYLYGDVRVYKDSIFMFCDSARLVNSDRFTALGNVVFVQSDTIKIFCDSLYYNSNSDVVNLYENVTLENGQQELFTDHLKYDATIKVATFLDTALLKVDKTLLQSIKGFYAVNEKKATFYDEVVLTQEDLRLRTDSLEYLTEAKRAIFVKPTRIVDDVKKIYCESGYYDLDGSQAQFIGNPQLVDGDDFAKADTILYNSIDSILTLKQNAQFIRKDQIATASTIIQDEKTQKTTMSGNAVFIDKGKKTSGNELVYSSDTKAVSVSGNAVYINGSSSLNAKNVSFNEATGNGLAKGDVTYKDTSSNFTLKASELFISESSNVKAVGQDQRPYLINLLEEDTMYLSADTLYREKLVLTDTLGRTDSINHFSGKGRVKILDKSFTAICDSISFSEQDSIFRLFDQPVVWSDSTQFSGDSILIFLREKKVDKIEVINKGFIIEELEPEIYNQIKGKKIDVFFKESELDSMNVNGSAESLYFFQDDEDAFVGVNKTLCGYMTFFFTKKDLDDIKFYQEPESVLTPIQQVDISTQRIKGFNWQINKAPINLESIIQIE